MFPNLNPPINRSETAMQAAAQRSKYARGPEQKYHSGVDASGWVCNLCHAACSRIGNPIAKRLCNEACNRTVCR